MNFLKLYVVAFDAYRELVAYADTLKVGSPRWEEVVKARDDMMDSVYEYKDMEPIGYGYIAKDSGKLMLVREDQKHFPHVFPLYGMVPEVVDKAKSIS